MEKKTGKELFRENIEAVIANHLVAVWNAGDSSQKENYRVTKENLIDFIEQNFAWSRKGTERWIKAKEDQQHEKRN